MNAPAIELRGVRRHFPRFELGALDLVVPTGTVMGLVGPNGAGKSTTLRIAMGLLAADGGSVRVLERELPREQVAVRREVAYVSEDMRPHLSQTLGFHLRFMASLFPAWDAAYAETLLRRFELDASQTVKALSRGQRMKACLLLALARRPRVLVLDEPTDGLDPLARRQVLEELAAVMADEERSVLFSSHTTLDVEQLSDRVTFMARGKVLFSENKEELLERWRRLRLDLSADAALPRSSALLDVRRSGRTATATARAYSDALVAELRAAGIGVVAVERMTLEEIFLASLAAPEGSAS
jgi:ABC-2 type transport system ATP-binding protein